MAMFSITLGDPYPPNHPNFCIFRRLPWHDKWKYATDPSSARNALSYGVKIAKIGPVDPEILDQIGPFFGGVIPDVHK